jgi:hypothetical protein
MMTEPIIAGEPRTAARATGHASWSTFRDSRPTIHGFQSTVFAPVHHPLQTNRELQTVNRELRTVNCLFTPPPLLPAPHPPSFRHPTPPYPGTHPPHLFYETVKLWSLYNQQLASTVSQFRIFVFLSFLIFCFCVGFFSSPNCELANSRIRDLLIRCFAVSLTC